MEIVRSELYQEDIKAKVRQVKVDKFSLVSSSPHHPISPHNLNVPLSWLQNDVFLRPNSTQVQYMSGLGLDDITLENVGD